VRVKLETPPGSRLDKYLAAMQAGSCADVIWVHWRDMPALAAKKVLEPLEELCRQDGGLRDNVPYEDYEFYMPDNLVYVNPRIGQENMKQMLKKAYRRFYTKPKVLYRNLLQLKDWDMLKKYWRALRLLF